MTDSSEAPQPSVAPGTGSSKFTVRVLGIVTVGAAIAAAWWLWKPAPKPIEKPEVAPARAADKTVRVPTLRHSTSLPAWTHTTGATGERLMPETLGGGVAIADFNGDGLQDIIAADGLGWSGAAFESEPNPATTGLALFQARQGAPFERVAITHPSIYAMGVYPVDFDGDDAIDLYVTGVKTPHTPGHLLLRNVTPAGGAVSFEDVTVAKGLSTQPDWGTAAVWFDADRDGDLDLLTAQYVKWNPTIDRSVGYTLTGVGRAYGPPTGFEGADPIFWRQNPDGTFTEATADAGFIVRNRATGVPVGKSLGAIAEDIDGDGDLDIVIANDTVANFAFLNDGSGKFTESGVQTGLAFDKMGAATGAMGIDAAALVDSRPTRAGRRAIAIGNFANEPDSFYTSPADRLQYTDDAILCGVGVPTRKVLTFGLLLEDVNSDGAIDVLQTNGHLEPEISIVQASQAYRQPGTLLLQVPGTGQFQVAEGAPIEAIASPRVGRGLATGDLTGRGVGDFVFSSNAGSLELVEGDASLPPGTRVFNVAARGSTGNRQGIGGAVIATLADGSVRRATIAPHRGYLSASTARARLVLAPGEQLKGLSFVWPDGRQQELPLPAEGAEAIVNISVQR